MLAAAVVAVAAAVSQRCRAQSMLQLDTETKITRFVKGQNLSVPLGVPAQPAVRRCGRGRAFGTAAPLTRPHARPRPPARFPPKDHTFRTSWKSEPPVSVRFVSAPAAQTNRHAASAGSCATQARQPASSRRRTASAPWRTSLRPRRSTVRWRVSARTPPRSLSSRTKTTRTRGSSTSSSRTPRGTPSTRAQKSAPS